MWCSSQWFILTGILLLLERAEYKTELECRSEYQSADEYNLLIPNIILVGRDEPSSVAPVSWEYNMTIVKVFVVEKSSSSILVNDMPMRLERKLGRLESF